MAFNIRQHAKIPGKFTGTKSGENAISHWQAWSDYIRVVGFAAPGNGGPDDRVVNFCLTLSDSAREWFSTLPNDITYANLGLAFKARFGRLPPIEVDMLQVTAAKKLPDESYQEFGSRITQKADRVGLIDQALLFFKKGVDANVGQYIMSRNCANIADAVQAAESIDGYLKVATPAAITQTSPEVHFQMQTMQETQDNCLKEVKDAIENMHLMQESLMESMLAFQERGRRSDKRHLQSTKAPTPGHSM